MYSAYKLNKKGDNIQPWCIPFLILEPVCCSMSNSNCHFLTCIHISLEAGQVVWYSHLLKKVSQFAVIHTAKGFGIVNKAEVDVFLVLSCFFHDPVDVGNLISGSSAFSKCSLNIWKFTVHVLLKPGLENFDHYLAKMWDECSSLNILWHCLSLRLEWKLTTSSPVATAEFSKFAGILLPRDLLAKKDAQLHSCELKFYLGQNKDCSLRGSTSYSSEKQLQRERSIYKV